MPTAMVAAGVHLVMLQLLPAAAISVQKHASAGAETSFIQSEGHAEGQSRVGSTIRFAESGSYNIGGTLGVMNKAGVTRYQDSRFRKVKRADGKFYWSDPNSREGSNYTGAKDLTQSVSWGWHHPAGVYSTIPVGAPLLDDEMNIYIGSDDAIRKFDVNGVIKWAYAPRGQLAAAPALCSASTRRLVAPVLDEEELVRPDWDKGESDKPAQSSQGFQAGDLVKVKTGASYWVDGKELFRAGDQGLISSVEGAGNDGRAVIHWTRNGQKSVVKLTAMQDRFTRVVQKKAETTTASLLIGSTTAGYVFAIDTTTGDEVWATWASNEIAGVKGSLSCKGGIVVVATDRCTDRYCYRYRNQTNPLTPGNTYVRGLSAVDGAALWEYKTFQPMWNFVPIWGPGTSVMFQDWEGRVYSLDFRNGDQIFMVGGDIGTHTNAAAVYSPGHNVVVALGMNHYTSGRCNPYPAPGIIPTCGTWPGTRGFVRGYNASSGRALWATETPEPPASASVGMLNSPQWSTRLIVTMGHNCFLGSPSKIFVMDPNSGHVRRTFEGPTLWSSYCAGDKEGADIRRAMGGREKCSPNSWSSPVVDSAGDVYVTSQVGEMYRYGATGGSGYNIELLSTLTIGVATPDAAIAIGNGMMAATTCTSLIVFQTYAADFSNATWSVSHGEYSPSPGTVHGDELSHDISEESHGDISALR